MFEKSATGGVVIYVAPVGVKGGLITDRGLGGYNIMTGVRSGRLVCVCVWGGGGVGGQRERVWGAGRG